MSTTTAPLSNSGGFAWMDHTDSDYDGTHTVVVGYILWLVGFTGAHRFYYGRNLTGLLWFFTLGLFGIGWIVDLFLIPTMHREAAQQFAPGPIDYNVAWLLLVLLGPLGLHRFVQYKFISGTIYFLTLGILGFGIVYDVLTMNDQIHQDHVTPYVEG